jgi:hypothetical protein
MSKLELLARIATARTSAHFRAALNAWHVAGYGPVPGWAIDSQIKQNPPTLDDYRRNMGEEPKP